MTFLKTNLRIYITLGLFFLAGCGADSGAPMQQNPNVQSNNSNSNAVYTGPAPTTSDVQNFRLYLWENLSAQNRCAQCHTESGQSPQFARRDDINLAYNAVNPYINLSSPSESALAAKVAQGHNCWLDDAQACGATIIAYIQAWAGQSIEGSPNQVVLVSPEIKSPGSSKNFPDSSSNFGSTIYPLLTTYCADCHSDTAQFAIAPYFASADVDVAYLASQTKIKLDDPAQSRFVVRLSTEFHNCWSDCSTDGAAMETAISNFADTIQTTSVNANWVTSKALNLLADGVAANAGGRYEANAIAKYEFKTGQGKIAYDTSPVAPALHLTLSGNVEWLSGWGLRFRGGKAQGSTSGSLKLYNKITTTGEYSIEAWVAPSNVTQEGPARIISYSGSADSRNFTLGQTLYNYDALNRSNVTDTNGLPALSTADADERLQATLQHVVVNFNPEQGRRIYVNGQYTGDVDAQGGGNLGDWDPTFALILGNEASNDFPWEGTIRQLVIHNRVLTDSQIENNYNVGVGQKFYLLFSVADLLNAPDSFIAFEVSQFDSYSYLFNSPFFVNLDHNTDFSTTSLKGLRIGINGQESSVGQAFAGLDTTIDPNAYVAGQGQVLSNLGTIIPLELGPDSDEFFLTFETFGDQQFVRTPVAASPLTDSVSNDEYSDIGVRTFDEINGTLASLTGVSPQTPAIADTFSKIKQQLPTVEAIDGFLSSHQMAITQLAIAYCNVLVEDDTLLSQKFPSLNTSSGPSVALNSSGRSVHIDELYNQFVGANLSNNPTSSEFNLEINQLFTRLIDDCQTCDDNGARTKTIAKATCAASLGSTMMLLQ